MFEVIDIQPKIGSEVRIDRDAFLAGTYAREIEQLLVERSALVFREIGLTAEEQRRFAGTIGTVTDQGDEGLSLISMNPEVSSVAGYTRGAFYWHIDGANDPIPAKATMLSAQVLAEEGGDTLICNTYAAYADLPADEKAGARRHPRAPRAGGDPAAGDAAADGGRTHPLARKAIADASAGVAPQIGPSLAADWRDRLLCRGHEPRGQRHAADAACRNGRRRTSMSIATSGPSATSCCSTTPAACTGRTGIRWIAKD